ncbi:unnamed protein product [Acanthosepion pharaonis]|uniref:Uncharacterized protein n=1 Tax=Acanthosepion pharaonis TaxID=158019 RepID=A0A812EGN9_ACAPH|nr:unnamed protein product [Sepia pharaonis]
MKGKNKEKKKKKKISLSLSEQKFLLSLLSPSYPSIHSPLKSQETFLSVDLFSSQSDSLSIYMKGKYPEKSLLSFITLFSLLSPFLQERQKENYLMKGKSKKESSQSDSLSIYMKNKKKKISLSLSFRKILLSPFPKYNYLLKTFLRNLLALSQKDRKKNISLSLSLSLSLFQNVHSFSLFFLLPKKKKDRKENYYLFSKRKKRKKKKIITSLSLSLSLF